MSRTTRQTPQAFAATVESEIAMLRATLCNAFLASGAREREYAQSLHNGSWKYCGDLTRLRDTLADMVQSIEWVTR